MRELLEQYLTEKQTGYLQTGRLLEVDALRVLTVRNCLFTTPQRFFGVYTFAYSRWQ